MSTIDVVCTFVSYIQNDKRNLCVAVVLEHSLGSSLIIRSTFKKADTTTLHFELFEMVANVVYPNRRTLGLAIGILGLTVPEGYGGTHMDATAVALVHEELSYADPAFCLLYLAHS
jgi:hypothetical protein